MKHLFQDFNPTSYTEWLSKIETDLKGKPLSVLNSNPEPDLEIVAYHHGETATTPISNSTGRNLARTSSDWKIRQEFSGSSDSDINKAILNDLNEGVTAVGLEVTSETDLEKLTDGILFEHIASDIRFSNKETACNANTAEQSILNYDIIGLNLKAGKTIHTLEDYLAFYNTRKNNKTIWVTGYQYGLAGASTVQELAATTAHANEYIQLLHNHGLSLEEINSKLVIELSVNENYFVNIAKFKVIRDLIALVFEAYDPTYQMTPITVFAKTNIRHLAQNDSNNNALRETTQAMSAIIGGCDVLTVNYTTFNPDLTARFSRISRNIQLILKEEAYLDKVNDPGAGSYYLESLSDQILNKSWELFQKIETEGGLIKATENNFVQEFIASNKEALIEAMLNEKNTFLGVNKYPNGMETWVDPTIPNNDSATDFSPLLPFYLEDHFSKTSVES